MDSLQRQQEKQVRKLGRLVKETIETKGWKDVIEPMLDKMISDIVGVKEGGRWVSGILNSKRVTDDHRSKVEWYAQALIEFHQRVYMHVDSAKELGKRKKDVGKRYTTPMQEGPYHNPEPNTAGWSYSPDEDGGLI